MLIKGVGTINEECEIGQSTISEDQNILWSNIIVVRRDVVEYFLNGVVDGICQHTRHVAAGFETEQQLVEQGRGSRRYEAKVPAQV